MSADLSGFRAAQVLFFVSAARMGSSRRSLSIATDPARVMNKASEYRANARKCRELASKTDANSNEDRELLLRMAEQWEQLARDRADLVRRHPELAACGDGRKR